MSTSIRHNCPTRKAGPWLRQSGNENALYDPETTSVHFLNDTALAIWDLCDGETTPEEMIEAICQLSGMHRDVIEEDVARTLHRFQHAGLITWER